jgi:hypothetical protein
MKEPQMRCLERLQQRHHSLLESVSRRGRFNLSAMVSYRVLPVLPEEFRFVKFGFEGLQNTFKNFVFSFHRHARFGAGESICIHISMMPQEASIDLQRIVVRTVIGSAHRPKEIGSRLGGAKIERNIHRDFFSVSFDSVPSS